ncbi:GNAT family N-acetyltransferase [Mucilaginibacter auburnensis]|uniref:Acetyltransferase (GNAT) family protein n=1 Tax=Mucilaginibacter auburnensis TaxID=1457233 RepID=A0A2H9VTH8_9SPHI|nr:GNAT family N-acetyltransferase [Mucilaginibacter auburnensis]PJJ84121.1 acetyltransferase (GNAT) family protein [Mucilaginibacter auburnensis]
MLIRKAKPEESDIIAPYLLLAMGDIAFKFIGENSTEKATNWLSGLISKTGNQYSFENCFVAEEEGEIVAIALVYDGGCLKQLRQPVAQSLKLMFNKDFDLEDETEAGEYYIDCVAVSPSLQGQGIGSKLFQFLIDEYVYKHGKTLGLLVDKQNPGAKKLYLKLGFKFVKDKMFAGKQMEHLQFSNNTII